MKISREIYEINGLKSFMKVKANAFTIDKTLLSFVEFDTSTKKSKHSLDVYVKTSDMLLFCQDVLSGKLPALAVKKAEGVSFPPAVFMRQGGVGPEVAKKKFGRTDGKAYARVFKFAASSKKGSFLFQGEAGPGKQDEKGLIQMENPTKPEIRINVPVSADELKAMCIMFQNDYLAWLASEYASGAFADTFQA